jgi:hypothetical protein
MALRHTSHSAGLLWTSDRPIAQMSDNTQHSQQTFTPLTEYEPAIPTCEWPQTHALDRTATRIGLRKKKEAFSISKLACNGRTSVNKRKQADIRILTFWLRDASTSLLYALTTVFMCCVYSDLCHLQHELVGFYNRDEKCLQRGTDWAFK